MSTFDEVINRRNTGCAKWDMTKEGELPMWVADMDFQTAPQITNALIERAKHGVFGYALKGDEWYEAYKNWWSTRHHFNIEKEWLMFCTGVIPALSSIVRKLTTPAENVVVMTPVYNHFFSSILNNGRNVLESKLKYENGEFDIDFKDLEEKLSNPQTTMMILCNPHNPIGKIWNKATLEKIGNMCCENHVIVVSDEIHCDIVEPEKEYIPFASISEKCKNNSITCVSPTKTFNIAGLQTAAILVPDEGLRNRVNRAINTDEVAEPNVFAAIAPVVAYNEGGEWLDELNKYLWENRKFAENFIKENIKGVFPIKAEATYLMWVDCTSVSTNSKELCDFIREKTGLFVTSGDVYRNADGFMRVNIACPRSVLEDGLNRLKTGIEQYLLAK
jgi:cystathionine beta-lyase